MTHPSPKPNITGKIESLAFGGEGVMRQDGLVIFVPYTAAGDTVEVKIELEKKRFARGRVASLLEASPDRTAPLCPYYEKCGGCQLQHIDYPAQREAKRIMVEDALKRIGKVDFPHVDIEEDQNLPIWAYRERIAMHLQAGKIGFIALDHRTVLEIDTCPIYLEGYHPLFKELQAFAQFFTSPGRVDVMKDGRGKFIVYVRLEEFDRRAKEALEMADQNKAHIASLEIKGVGYWGEETAESDSLGLKILYSPKVFIQSNRSVSEKINLEIKMLLSGSNKVLDLYSGIGVSSLLLAKEGKKVISIESNVVAVEYARENAYLNQVDSIEFITGEVESNLKGLLNEESFDAALINPPREGLYPEVAEALKNSGIKTLIYISCMPSTLARDVNILAEGGYSIKKVKAFDMFPQTGHIETLLQLTRN